MTSNSEKLRSLFLSALMVFSVFAVTVSLSGGAAAAVNNGVKGPLGPGDGSALSSENTFYAGEDVYVNGLEANKNYQVRAVDTSGDSNSVGGLSKSKDADSQGVVNITLDGELSEGSFVLTEGSNSVINISDGSESNLQDGEAINVSSSPSATDINNAKFEVVTQDLSATLGDDTAGVASDADTVEFEINSDVRTGYNVNVSADGLDADDLESIFDNSGTNSPGTQGNVTKYSDDDVVEITAEQYDEWDLNFSDIDEGTYTFEVNVTDSSANDSATIEATDVGDATAEFDESLIEEDQGDVAEIPVQLENTDTATVEIGDFSDDNYNLTVEVEDGNDDGQVTLLFNTYSAGAVNASGDSTDTYDIESNQLIGGVVQADESDDTILSARENGSFSENAGEARDGTKYGFTAAGSPEVADRAVGENILDASSYDIRAQSGENAYVSNEDDVATLDIRERTTGSTQFWTLPDERVDAFTGEDNDERIDLINQLKSNNNLTQTDTLAISDVNDAGVVQVDASGLEGVFEYHLDEAGGGLSDRAAVYDNISSQNANNAYSNIATGQDTSGGNFTQPFATSIDDESASANTDDSGQVLGTDIGSSSYTVTYDATNDTHYILFDQMGNTISAEDGDEYAANYSMSNSDGDGLTGESITETDEFQTNDADGEINNDVDITVTANQGQTISAETNVAPGTEIVIRARSTSQTAGAPFLKQPTGVVQPDGTIEATGNFEDTDAGSNFTAQLRVGGTNIGDSVDGTVLNATAETPTEATEEPETETEAPETEAPETEESTEMETEMGTEEPTEETTTGGSGPGFTAAIALIALIAAALLAVRRDN